MDIPVEGLRLNVGAGGRHIDGWVGVDAVKRDAADIVADARSIPLPDGCAVEVMAIHLVEHFYAWEVSEAFAEWFRLLRPRGRLILEMPDIVKSCRNIADGVMKAGKHPDQLGLWGVFGDPRLKDPLMGHKYGWTSATIKPLLAEAGFHTVLDAPTQFHPAGREFRDFRVEARKA